MDSTPTQKKSAARLAYEAFLKPHHTNVRFPISAPALAFVQTFDKQPTCCAMTPDFGAGATKVDVYHDGGDFIWLVYGPTLTDITLMPSARAAAEAADTDFFVGWDIVDANWL